MKSTLGIELFTQIEAKSVDFATCLKCLNSPHLFDQALGFTALTEPHVRKWVSGINQQVDVPNLLLTYLLNCIVTDLPSEVCEDGEDDYVHDRGEAFLDLRVPLDPYWQLFDCKMSDEDFFKQLSGFLAGNAEQYFEELPTNVLEAWSPMDEEFGSVMRSWKSATPLKRYVADLEKILSVTF